MNASRLLTDDAEDVFLAHHQELFAVDGDFRPGVLAEKDAVALLHFERQHLAVIEHFAVSYRDDLAFLRLLFRGVRDDDPALRLFFLGQAPDDYPVAQW